MRIVMFSAEAAPYAKVGGLADVVGALPKALSRLDANTTIVLPAYRSIDPNRFNLSRCTALSEFDVQMGPLRERATVLQGRTVDSGVDVFLIGSAKYFDREAIYDDPVTKEGYPDNAERFIFFMNAGIELIDRLGISADIIHCHDSHTALIPAMLKTIYTGNARLRRAGTVFTIHNLAYQGLSPKESLAYAGIGLEQFYPGSPFEYWGQVNFMKAGIEFADKVNTVSRTYANEIQTDPEFGMGLEGVLSGRKEDLSGIVNGIDYDEWDPEKDPHIPAPYSPRDLSGKQICKERLLREFGLPTAGRRVPLVGIVSRLADQKGFDLIEQSVDEMMELGLRLIVLGTGQKKYHELFSQIAARHPGKAGVRLGFDNALAHRIEAGCDMFLMPSRFEPCGLNQLYSLRYGTIPVVRATGGLADTVTDFSQANGTGFLFAGYAPGEMLTALKRALAAYSDEAGWRALQLRAMAQDWSWAHSAAEYMELYKSILSDRIK